MYRSSDGNNNKLFDWHQMYQFWFTYCYFPSYNIEVFYGKGGELPNYLPLYINLKYKIIDWKCCE